MNPTNEHREQARERLLPCPWCSQPPEVNRAAGYGFTVECVNETCAVGPSLNVTRGRANAIKAWNTQTVFSSRDAEIRKVLEGLRNPHRHVDLCWCDHDARFEPHDAACLATQALYAKLQPGKEGKDSLILE